MLHFLFLDGTYINDLCCTVAAMTRQSLIALLASMILLATACTTTEEKTMNTTVIIETTMGSMTFTLFDDKAPVTTTNFKTLTNKKFYDGVIFHRVIKNFMIQGGDPTGTGMGGPGYTIKDEFHAQLKHDKKGILSMANSGPNTGGSQFFITLTPTPWLDGKHAVFGEVTDGIDVLEKIGTVATDDNDRPLKDIVIKTMRVVS